MIWTAILGALGGLTVGWRAGRLHQHARHRVDTWRGTVAAVPVAYRSAVEAVKAAVKFIGGLALVAALVLLVVWGTRSSP